MDECPIWVTPPPNLSLLPNETHVWRARLDVEPDVLKRAAKSLAPDENSRAERFRFPRDRDHFIAAHGILRNILGRTLAYPPAEIRFSQGPYGKPVLSGELLENPIRFNLAHSHGWTVFVFGWGREVGIDIERIRAEVVPSDIVDRYFSAAERNEFLSLPEELRAEAFFLGWTRKEAYLKAHGSGLQVQLNSFDVSLDPRLPPTLRSPDAERWVLRTFQPAAGYTAALVSEAGSGEPHFWEFTGWS